MTKDFIVKSEDLKPAKVCARGARRFLRSKGLDAGEFFRNGLPASELTALNDKIVDRVVGVANGRQK